MPTIANLDLSGFCIFAGFISSIPLFADASGVITRVDGASKKIQLHDGLLCAEPSIDKKLLLTGGEDGKVCSINANGDQRCLAEVPRKWISCIAPGPSGSIAFGVNKTTTIIDARGIFFEQNNQRTIEGVALAPKGMRLAAAHYNGVSLFFAGINAPSVSLEWKGAHNKVCFSPDGRYVISTMQENALHGWRIDDGKHMRMNGYPSKVKSWSWSRKAHYLATSGAEAAILWPFMGKDGPMGKAPLELGMRDTMRVTAVACHPTEDLCAIGYSDGMVLLVLFSNGKEVLLRRSGQSALTCLNWDESGFRLAFGSETGEGGIITLQY
jgi:WD40 repeat protein